MKDLHSINGRLVDALGRLVNRCPKNPKFASGRYNVNVTNVAIEAGVSRNTIYKYHRGVADQIRQIRTKGGSPKKEDPVVIELRKVRAENKELKRELRTVYTNSAVLLKRSLSSEKENVELRRLNAELISERRDRLTPVGIRNGG